MVKSTYLGGQNECRSPAIINVVVHGQLDRNVTFYYSEDKSRGGFLAGITSDSLFLLYITRNHQVHSGPPFSIFGLLVNNAPFD